MTTIIKLVFLALCVVAWIQSQSLENSNLCGLENSNVRKKRTVGGRNTTTCQFPWTVHVQNLHSGSLCIGALINNKNVIVAASCLYKGSPKVVVNIEDLLITTQSSTGNGLTFNVIKVYPHEEYNHSTHHNIGFLSLESSVALGQCPKSACLVVPGMQPQITQNRGCIGNTAAAFVVSPNEVLRKWQWVNQTLSTNQSCENVYGSTVVTNNTFCARGQNQGICEGDSNGLLLCKHNDDRYYLYGLVAHARGQDCGSTDTLFTNVTSYMSWIGSKLVNVTA